MNSYANFYMFLSILLMVASCIAWLAVRHLRTPRKGQFFDRVSDKTNEELVASALNKYPACPVVTQLAARLSNAQTVMDSKQRIIARQFKEIEELKK